MDVNLRTILIATVLMTSAAAFAQPSAPEVKPTTPTDGQGASTIPPTAAEPAASNTPAADMSNAAIGATIQIAPGAAVLDANGASVGTIASVSSDIAVVDTGAVKASIPAASLAKSDKGLLIGMTKAELEAAARSAGAPGQGPTELKAGIAVFDPKGASVGTIESVDGDSVTVATPRVKAKLPKASLAIGLNGAVISMTQSQLEAAVAARKSPAG